MHATRVIPLCISTFPDFCFKDLPTAAGKSEFQSRENDFVRVSIYLRTFTKSISLYVDFMFNYRADESPVRK